jgi:hypothetical protein
MPFLNWSNIYIAIYGPTDMLYYGIVNQVHSFGPGPYKATMKLLYLLYMDHGPIRHAALQHC